MSSPLFSDPPKPVEPSRRKKSEPDRPSEPKRTRKRPPVLDLGDEGERAEIAARVKRFYQDDLQTRLQDSEARIQRHAKFRQWTQQGAERWTGASDIAMGDIASVVYRTEDTLQNACLSTRPIVTTKSQDPDQTKREQKIDDLLDYQFWREQDGEHLIEQLSCDFVREGSCKALSRWILEHTESVQVRYFAQIPADEEPRAYFERLMGERIQNLTQARELPESEGWDWRAKIGEEWFELRFYTEELPKTGVILEIRGQLRSYDGPMTFRYPWDHVLYPYFCENLQAPSPSNPNGAAHVIFVDWPTVEEIRRGIRDGEYDLASLDDLEGVLGDAAPEETRTATSIEREKDEMRGYSSGSYRTPKDSPGHGRICRLLCFDLYEGEDGPGRDVVWTVLREPNLLLRAQAVGEVSPGNPPLRPISHAAMIPIPGRVDGIGIPELMEGLHDSTKEVYDLLKDSGELEAIPWFTYRQSSMVNPEEYRIAPGHGLPVGQRGDIEPQSFRAQSGPVLTNIITLLDRQQQDLTMQGDLQAGRIPSGKSAALRTSGGIQQVLAQGEARPERQLRRFFRCIRQIHLHMWTLDQAYMPEEKSFRVVRVSGRPDEQIVVRRREDLSADVELEFQANILNASKVAMQQAMETIFQILLNPLAMQMGISSPDSAYRLLSDYLRALGQQPEKYLNSPTPKSNEPRIMAADAFTWILRGMMPVGVPAEGSAEQHLQTLLKLLDQKTAEGQTYRDLLQGRERILLREYIQRVGQLAQQENEQAQLQGSAGALRTELTQQGGQGGTQAPQQGGGPGLVNAGGTLDGSLPSSGTPQ